MGVPGPPSTPHPTTRLVGTGPAMEALRVQIRHLAAFDSVGSALVPPLLLQGETGTGKGLVARVVHDSGPRATGPFIDVNCAAIPETMLEAELFGFEPGAFTDAKRAKPGLFETASGGTLFLDEIDALPLVLQGKLLTAIEGKQVRRLGGVTTRAVDVKLIVATNAALPEHIAAGRFRADLYHRLAVIVVTLPPLRERGEDILALARAFLQQYSMAHGIQSKRLSAAAVAWLQSYAWPGNVRELSHLMERVTLLHVGEEVDAGTLAQLCLPLTPSVASTEAAGSQALAREPEQPMEATQLRQALAQTGGNVALAARLLGVSRDTVRYRMRRYGIGRPRLAGTSTGVPAQAERIPPDQPRPAAVPDAGGQALTAERVLPASDDVWEQKPVAVLALEVTWPEVAARDTLRYDPWTQAAHWEQVIREKVQGFGGVVLQHTASLCTWVFGVAQALDQLPQRAVHSALVIRQMAAEEMVPTLGACPEVRLTVHLGAVRVQGQPPTARVLAVGETLALPVRLLGQAAAGEILVSPSVGRLVTGWVALEERALQLRTGSQARVGGDAVLGVRPGRTPQMSDEGQARTLFVGRKRELAMLEAVLAQVDTGQGQVVGIVGAPGMGKSRLLAEVRQRLSAQQVQSRVGHCLAYGSTTPYLPVLDLLREHCGIVAGDPPAILLTKLCQGLVQSGLDPAERLPYLSQLLGLPGDPDQVVELSAETRRARTFETLQQLFLGAGRQHPLVLAVEDLHWIDPTSEAWLAELIDWLSGVPLVVVTTARPGYRPPWGDKSYMTQVALQALGPEDSRQVVRSVLPDIPLAPGLEQQLLAKAEGNPFFLEELAHAVREHGEQQASLAVPETIQAVLATRIDRLPAPEKRLVQVAAVIGKDVATSVLQAVAAVPEDVLSRGLAHLQRVELLVPLRPFPTPVYTFKHVLTQEVAYQSLPPESRRQAHQHIAEVLLAQFPEVANTQPEVLAQHYSEAGAIAPAITAWQQAGQRATARSAHVEAIAHFSTGLALLQTLPDTLERARQELTLQTALGPALIATKGYAALEVEQTYARARALCERVGQTPQLFPVLFGLWVFALMTCTAALHTARALADRLLEIAQGQDDPGLRLEAHVACGMTCLHAGEPARSLAHLEAGQALYNPSQHHAHAFLYGQDPGVVCLAYGAAALLFLGYRDRALARGYEALSLAQELADPFSLALATFLTGVLHQERRELAPAQERAETLLTLTRQRDFVHWLAQGTVLHGWTVAAQGRGEAGLAQIRHGLAMQRTIGSAIGQTHWLVLLADACRMDGQNAAGLAAVAEGLAWAGRTGEQFYTAELYRLQGELCQQATDAERRAAALPASPAACVQQALTVARQQGAKLFELRAATCLSRLWQRQGKREAAQHLLAEVYGWCTEGFETADLQEARALLEELG